VKQTPGLRWLDHPLQQQLQLLEVIRGLSRHDVCAPGSLEVEEPVHLLAGGTLARSPRSLEPAACCTAKKAVSMSQGQNQTGHELDW
jgi:hypothetical protein